MKNILLPKTKNFFLISTWTFYKKVPEIALVLL